MRFSSSTVFYEFDSIGKIFSKKLNSTQPIFDTHTENRHGKGQKVSNSFMVRSLRAVIYLLTDILPCFGRSSNKTIVVSKKTLRKFMKLKERGDEDFKIVDNTF